MEISQLLVSPLNFLVEKMVEDLAISLGLIMVLTLSTVTSLLCHIHQKIRHFSRKPKADPWKKEIEELVQLQKKIVRFKSVQ